MVDELPAYRGIDLQGYALHHPHIRVYSRTLCLLGNAPLFRWVWVLEFRVRWTVGAQTVGAGLCTESSPINTIISFGLRVLGWGFRVRRNPGSCDRPRTQGRSLVVSPPYSPGIVLAYCTQAPCHLLRPKGKSQALM